MNDLGVKKDFFLLLKPKNSKTMNISGSGKITATTTPASSSSASSNELNDEKVTGKRVRLEDVTSDTNQIIEKKIYSSISLPLSSLPKNDFKSIDSIDDLNTSLGEMRIASSQRILKPQPRRSQGPTFEGGATKDLKY